MMISGCEGNELVGKSEKSGKSAKSWLDFIFEK